MLMCGTVAIAWKRRCWRTPCSPSYVTGKIFTCFWLTNELIQLFPQKSGVKRSKGAGTTPLMSQKLMCISLIHFVIIKERPDSQICRLDGYGVGLGITSGQNLASEPLGAGATRWSTCWVISCRAGATGWSVCVLWDPLWYIRDLKVKLT